MTVLNELVPLAIDGAHRNITGIYNFTNPGVISHNEVLQLYRDYSTQASPGKTFLLRSRVKSRLLAPRSNNKLDSRKLENTFPGLLDIRSSLIKHVFEVNRERGTRIAKVQAEA